MLRAQSWQGFILAVSCFTSYQLMSCACFQPYGEYPLSYEAELVTRELWDNAYNSCKDVFTYTNKVNPRQVIYQLESMRLPDKTYVLIEHAVERSPTSGEIRGRLRLITKSQSASSKCLDYIEAKENLRAEHGPFSSIDNIGDAASFALTYKKPNNQTAPISIVLKKTTCNDELTKFGFQSLGTFMKKIFAEQQSVVMDNTVAARLPEAILKMCFSAHAQGYKLKDL
jgi:hypothetical protein